MAIVSSSTVTDYLNVSSYTSEIQIIHTAVEQLIKKYCEQPFESTSYTEKYNGHGGHYLNLKNIPIISVDYLITDSSDVIKIKSTATDSSLANIKISPTNLILTISGGTSENSSTLSFTTYTTLSDLVTAINAISGWSAEILSTNYNSLSTGYLYDQVLDCTQKDGVLKSENYIKIANIFSNVVIYDADRGIIYSDVVLPRGFQNIIVKYTAGYTSVPADISFVVLDMTKELYQKYNQNAENIASWRVGDVSFTYSQVRKAGVDMRFDILDHYRRFSI